MQIKLFALMELVDLPNKIVFHQMNVMNFQYHFYVLIILVHETDLNVHEVSLVDMDIHFAKITNAEKHVDLQPKA